jgi:hypothetical protein
MGSAGRRSRRTGRRLAGAATLGAAALTALLLAGGALGSWSTTASGGGMTLVTATLDAPASVQVHETCTPKVSTVETITWTASTSPAVAGYSVYRSNKAGRRYTLLGTVAGRTTTSYDDTTAGWNKTYNYVVTSTRNGWTSPDSAAASITTSKKNCN